VGRPDRQRKITMAKLDITRTNDAVTRLLEVTENPRHRYMLLTYYRHRFLEIAGRYEEIFAPTMMADNPVYHFRALGITARLERQDQVKGLYAQWAKTGECVFYTDDEQLAIGDTMICSIATGYSPKPGAVLRASGFNVDDENTMYLYKAVEEMVWPFDERGRVAGEDVWEPDPDRAEISKLDPADVITTEEAGRLLEPYIEPLPSFDEMVTGRQPVQR
jgi:hypothetical protein